MSFVKRPGAISNWFLPGILSGMKLTMVGMIQNLFRIKPIVTLNYPEERYEYSARFKGNHILTVRKDGSLRCTACMLCATYCPADCITIVADEHEDPEVEKYPVSYDIDILRCVFCGFCEEACPLDAIRMGPEWMTPGLADASFKYDIKHLAHRASLKGGIQTRVDDQERDRAGI